MICCFVWYSNTEITFIGRYYYGTTKKLFGISEFYTAWLLFVLESIVTKAACFFWFIDYAVLFFNSVNADLFCPPTAEFFLSKAGVSVFEFHHCLWYYTFDGIADNLVASLLVRRFVQSDYGSLVIGYRADDLEYHARCFVLHQSIKNYLAST